MSRRIILALCCLAILAVAGPVWAASEAPKAGLVGEGGEIYRVVAGSYGDLFPGGTETAPDHAVLALEIRRSSSETDRFLVPGTEGEEVETGPALALLRNSSTVYLVWEAWSNPYSLLYLASYDGESWSDVFEYSGNPFSAKSNPQLAVTRHRDAVLAEDGSSTSVERTVLHLVWWDESGVGNRTLYTPLVFEDGSFVGFNPLFDLEDFLVGGSEASAEPLPEHLAENPIVVAGSDDTRVVAGFASEKRGRMATVEIAVIPSNLVSLADRSRAQIILIGTAKSGVSRSELAELVRADLMESGSGLLGHQILDYLTDRLVDVVAASDPEEELPSLADRSRAQIILIGSSLAGGDLSDHDDRRIVEVDPDADGEAASHNFAFRPVSERTPPPAPDRPLSVFVSPDGTDLLVAWDVPAGVRYVESDGDDGWTPRRTVETDEELSRTDVYSILGQRLAGN